MEIPGHRFAQGVWCIAETTWAGYCRYGEHMGLGRINGRWLVPALAGILLLVVGLYVGQWSSSSWSNVAIALGSATLLFAIGVVVEPLIVRRIGKATEAVATAAAELATQDLSQRVTRLEDISSEQAKGRQQRQYEFDSVLASLRESVTVESLGQALVTAHRYRLLNHGHFCVRTNSNSESPELYFLALRDSKKIVFIWLSFSPMDTLVPLEVGNELMNVPPNEDGIVLWGRDESAGQVASRLEEELIVLNSLLTSEFSFEYALERMIKSIEIMFESRTAPRNSPYKLKGSLNVLINDEWALTSRGLEAVHLLVTFGADELSRMDSESECPPGASPERWIEALHYVLQRRSHWIASLL